MKDIVKVLDFIQSGGAGGDRTLYLFNAIEALSQVSYSPTVGIYDSKGRVGAASPCALCSRTIAKSLSLPVILTLSLPKGKNPTLSAETLRSAQGDMKATLQSSCPLQSA